MKVKLEESIDSAQTSSSYTSNANTNDSGVNSATSHSQSSQNSFLTSAVKSEPPATPLKDSSADHSDLKKVKLKPNDSRTGLKAEKRSLDSDDDELPLTSR